MSAPAPPNLSRDAQIDHAALRIAYQRLLLSVAFTIGTALLLLGFLPSLFPIAALQAWTATIMATSLARLGLWFWHRREAPGIEAVPVWSRRFLAGSVAAAAAWSVGGVWLLPTEGQIEVAILCVSLLGVSSVAVSSLAAHLPSMLAFVLIVLSPVSIWLLRGDTTAERLVGTAFVISMLASAWIGRQSNQMLRQLLRTELELKAAIDDATLAQQAAEDASGAKSRFLATMSHEVRTPLNGVLGLAELLEGTTLDASQQRHLRLLRLSGENLRAIVDDILDFSRIEADQMSVADTEFAPRQLAEDAFEMWKPRARAAGLAMRLEASVELPKLVRGDAIRLRQVLDNFLGNAVKFTARGTIELRVDADGRKPFPDGRPVRLRFAVQDTGIGIAPESLERIFEPFTQLDDSASRRFGGTGLGLAICRRIATRLGGGLGVESTPGIGSTFSISVPLLAVSRAASDAGVPDDLTADALLNARIESRPGSDPAARPDLVGRVLMVEDNEVNREVCGAMLELLGLEFDEAVDGVEALARATTRHYDLVLMDCQMPQLDGLAATRELRQRGIMGRDGRPLPIIALTANAFAEDRERARESGMDDFLAKPVRLETLRASLARWLPEQGRADARPLQDAG